MIFCFIKAKRYKRNKNYEFPEKTEIVLNVLNHLKNFHHIEQLKKNYE